MSQRCQIPACARTVAGICACCDQKVCQQHFNEHRNAITDQLNHLTDHFNTINNRITDLRPNDLTESACEQLEQCRGNYHRRVDEIFNEKRQELERRADEKINQFKKNATEVHRILQPILANQDADQEIIKFTRSKLRLLEQVLDNMNQRAFTVVIPPIMIDEHCINIEEFTEHSLKLLALESVPKKKECPDGSYAPIASNDQHLLYHYKPELRLLNEKLEEIKKIPWKHDKIQGMCWCSSSKQFLITTEHKIFAVDKNLNSVQQIQVVNNRILYSCTCSDQSLFVLGYDYSSPILQYRMSPSIEFIREWAPPDTCQNGEWINDINCDDRSMALVIKNLTNKSCRIELKNVQTFARLWQLQLNLEGWGTKAFACCSVAGNEWFVFDTDNNQLLYIKEDRTMGGRQSYKEPFWFANMFGNKLLAVTTKKSIHFYDC